ncbi:MAG: leucyl aminopeptidase family protein, partial [Hyphomicrobiales bacterium]|nr:leucyl aminopeptidase family protein [Hyphomicrobiales bacterium]
MSELLVKNSDGNPIVPIRIVDEDGFADFTGTLAPAARRWIETTGYRPKPGAELVVPDMEGGVQMVLFGRPQAGDPFAAFLPAKLAGLLPAGFYRFADPLPAAELTTLAWALEGYRFDRYTEKPPAKARLVADAPVDVDAIQPIVEGVFLARDLINTPANDLGPAELEMAMRTLAERHGAAVRSVVGEALLAENFPLVHAVGAASDRAPRLIDLSWGDAADPKVTLVGKGVCYDTGGLDIK